MKHLLVVIFLVSVLLSGCKNNSYNSGFKEGYAAAKAEIGDQIDHQLEEIYLEGYSDGFAGIASSRTDAEYYAMDRSEFSPEEAMMIIDAYESNSPFWRNGDPPSYQDYANAARTLYHFYEYYFNGEFRHYQDP